MFSRKLTTTAFAILGLGIFAGSAHAAVIDTDSVKLTSSNVDFGGSTFVFGDPTGSGSLTFTYSGGKITPRLTGYIHLDDADGMCGKVRLESFDSAGNLLDKSYGGEVCANDDKHHSWSVDFAPYSDSRIASVRVAVDKETTAGWFVEDTQTVYANTFPDDVKVTADGIDVGGDTFGLSAPTNSGTMYWNLNNGTSTPHLVATLWINNSSGVCGRVNLRYLTDAGSELASEPGGTVCAPDNGLHSWSVDLDPYSSNKIGKVQVQLQTEGTNGSYNTAASQTVSIAQ